MITTTPTYRSSVEDLIARLGAEPFPERRAGLRRDLQLAAHVLMGDRDRLRQRLIDGDAWLTANTEAVDVEARTDTWIDWLHDLERTEDALTAAREAVG